MKKENNGVIFLITVLSWIVSLFALTIGDSITYWIFTALWIFSITCLIINLVRGHREIKRRTKLLEEQKELTNTEIINNEQENKQKKDRQRPTTEASIELSGAYQDAPRTPDFFSGAAWPTPQVSAGAPFTSAHTPFTSTSRPYRPRDHSSFQGQDLPTRLSIPQGSKM